MTAPIRPQGKRRISRDEYSRLESLGFTAQDIADDGLEVDPMDAGSGNEAIGPSKGADGYADSELEALITSEPVKPKKGAGGWRGTLQAFGSHGLQGATFGFLDELAGLDEATASPQNLLHPIKSYREGRDRVRAALERQKAEHKIASIGGEITGAIASPINKLLLPLKGASVVRGAKAGAKGGALYGAGAADELSDVPLSATLGGVAGGAAGAGGSLLMQALAAGASRAGSTETGQRIANTVRARMGQTPMDRADRAKRKAAEAALKALARDKAGPAMGPRQADDVANALELAGQELAPNDPRMLFNLGGRNTTTATRVSQSIPSEATDAVPRAINAQLEQGPERLLGDVSEAIGGPIPNPLVREQQLADDAARAAKPHYDLLRNVPVQGDDAKAVLNRPAVRDAMSTARSNLLNKGEGVPDEASVGMLDDVKKILDDQIESINEKIAQGKASGADKSSLKGLEAARQALIDQADNATAGDYARARAIAQKAISKREAFREGRNYGRTKRDQIEVDMPARSPENAQAYREGAATDIENVIMGTPDKRNLASRLFGSNAEREKLRTVFADDPKALDLLESAFKREDALRKQATEAGISGQSMTAPLREGIEDFTGAGAEQFVGTRDVKRALLRKALTAASQARRNLNSKAAGELGRIMTSKPGSALMRELVEAQADLARRSARGAHAGRRAGVTAGLLTSGER